MRSFITTLFIIATADCTNAEGSLNFIGPPKQLTRIVGGSNAEPCELKYQASLQDIVNNPDIILCGGSIVDDHWILTAGHCVAPYISRPHQLKVTTGEYEVFVHEGTEQYFSVSDIYVHEGYSGQNHSNDIALLRLSTPIKFDDCSDSIPLRKRKEHPSGNCVISGWGLVLENGSPSNILQKATVPIMTEDDCRQFTSMGENIDDSMICAGFDSGGTDTCQGDSGGPLVCNEVGVNYLVGVVSWGNGCGRSGSPGVYAAASKYVEWLENQMDSGVDSVSFSSSLLFVVFIAFRVCG